MQSVLLLQAIADPLSVYPAAGAPGGGGKETFLQPDGEYGSASEGATPLLLRPPLRNSAGPEQAAKLAATTTKTPRWIDPTFRSSHLAGAQRQALDNLCRRI
ncbi:MAG TPA: hypothetical protein VFN61_05180, partial [Acidimicrobiales bacterium]|nr:hypothetical protein [Acidimicrobiales bacterium]